jgi:hypothetical protein
MFYKEIIKLNVLCNKKKAHDFCFFVWHFVCFSVVSLRLGVVAVVGVLGQGICSSIPYKAASFHIFLVIHLYMKTDMLLGVLLLYMYCMLVREIWIFIHPRVSYSLRATHEGNMILEGEYIFIFPEPACYQCFIIPNETKKTHTCEILLANIF